MAKTGLGKKLPTLIEDHWLDQLLLPVCAIGFAGAAAALAVDFFTAGGSARIGWWVTWAAVLAAAEGVYVGPVLVKARTPTSLQWLEIGLIDGAAYGILHLEGATFPFWAIGRALKTPAFFAPLLAITLAWYLGRSAGKRFARIGTIGRDLGEQVAAKLAWDQESVVSVSGLGDRRASATRFFSRRLLIYTFWASLITAGILDSYPEMRAGGWRWQIVAETSLLLFTGLVLQGCVYLYRLRSLWDMADVKILPGLFSQWLKGTFLLALGVLIVGLLLPAGFAPFDFHRVFAAVSGWLSRFLSQGIDIFNKHALGDGPVGEGGQRATEGVLPGGSPGTGDISSLAGLVLMYFYGLAVAAITLFSTGALLLVFLRSEWRKLPGIVKLPVYVFLWTRSVLGHVARGLLKLWEWGARRVASREVDEAANGKERVSRAGPAGNGGVLPSYVRRMFVSLIRLASAHGLPPRPNQTPSEFAATLKEKLPDAEPQLDEITQTYLDVRYGGRPDQETKGQRLRSAWEKVVEQLRSLARTDL